MNHFPPFVHNRNVPQQAAVLHPPNPQDVINHLLQLGVHEQLHPDININIPLNMEERLLYVEVEVINLAELELRINNVLRPHQFTVNGLIEHGYQIRADVWPSTIHTYLERVGRIVMRQRGHRMISTQSNTRDKAKARKISTILIEILRLIRDSDNKSKTGVLDQYCSGNNPLFDSITDVENTLIEICVLLNCTRNSLPIFSLCKGQVSGFIRITNDGLMLDGTVGREGCNIRCNSVLDHQTDALFILVVESHAMFTWLNDRRFWEQYPCIIITGKGFPDLTTLRFLKNMQVTFNIPVCGFFYPNPHGFQIFRTYLHGSKKNCHESFHLTIRNMRWIGMTLDDIRRYYENDWMIVTTRLSGLDRSFLRKNLQGNWIQAMPAWWRQALQEMRDLNSKGQMELLHFFDHTVITDGYLPSKLLLME